MLQTSSMSRLLPLLSLCLFLAAGGWANACEKHLDGHSGSADTGHEAGGR